MESDFGHDFSRVRLHTDKQATDSADSLGALAYTAGQDIVFASDQYAPRTPAGRQLLAHELAHVVQQGNRPVSDLERIVLANPLGDAERKADEAATQIAATSDPTRQGDHDQAGPEIRCRSGGDAPPSLGQFLEWLLPADPSERARILGQRFSQQAVGVDGTWLAANLDAGAPLDPELRLSLEDQFGVDLSSVRIHSNSQADIVAQTLNAQAVTVGQHIAFAKGKYNPKTESGRTLMLHEVAHTIQQKKVSRIPPEILPITGPAHSAETEAQSLVQSVAGRSTGGVPGRLSQFSTPHVSRSICGMIVEAACWASFAAIAAAITALCTIGSVITVGGLAIPCTAVVIASAGLAAWDAVMCSHVLKDAICGERITSAQSGSGAATSAEATA